MMNKRIDNYSVMISSKYFESIEDFINLEMAVKRFNGNMERFHFNPIPLNVKTRKFFSNLETLHLYNESDMIFDNDKIFRNCIWYKVNYDLYLKEKEKGNDCKLICYTKSDRIKYGIEIPNNVKILEDYCFFNCKTLLSINIPSSVVYLGNSCFGNCAELTSIILPKKLSKLGVECFCQCGSLKSIEIPLFVTELNDFCFYNCSSLVTITISTSVVELNFSCFNNCLSLSLIEIPSSVTKINDYCFYNCTSLTLTKIPNSVKLFGESCFYNCEVNGFLNFNY